MILGLSTPDFTLLHVIISLIGILSGGAVLIGMLRSNRAEGWAALFLATTILTSVTGFMFPITKIGPPHIFGAISLPLLAAAVAAFYVYRLKGRWRWIYIVAAMLSLYLNAVVAVVQSFQKLPHLQVLAPTQSEPPFLIVQVAMLALFAVTGFMAVKKFHPERKI
ncbi:MAG: hypothetical protein WDO70_08045 [Alphaproteobacteria bacterium]